MKVDVRAIKKGKLRATATVTWGDTSTIGARMSGFKVLESMYPTDYKDGDGTPLWVRPPAYTDNQSGAFHSILFTSEEVWKLIEAKIIEAYFKVLGEE